MTAYGSIDQAVNAMRNGVADYLVKPFEPEVLVKVLKPLLLAQVGSQQAAKDQPVVSDPISRELLQLASRVAKSDASVMIGGESGTGKEVLARFIHAESDRATKPFIAINCAAIPESLLEATLFGYEKG
ncbi:MAG: sigma-54-dependent Fis family transcriptional regulator, partial [Pseudomonadaceae bacterium]|nr:sigma-54-dependent Fis family transcriptional regulator [Pseudomonadaceae bacterium]